mmetsp:Transcript_24529/g.41025  ORF Transcript_24529/g.41025 Transcript_24529/m.41025 type:complete len:84 (-) Transcript_24529:216-467(-)|eukprot:CAMPEP_0198208400 /NCGR_PEP_ID=MMETSP1445-20131203/11771_1 /TAXON_ID=36898 /ORGANISM="Pyramimonas sp., Strain CCMP2087" /LENGTH=83 /DNA_ID=CAMNT_0043881785 /DNA_START=118 /DNA_END=369 /DNA_ORIENTATION=+
MAAAEVPVLYRAFLREGNRYTNYNVKEYVLRRVKEKFAEGRALSGADAAAALVRGRAEFEVVKRQAAISRLYTSELPSIMNKK